MFDVVAFLRQLRAGGCRLGEPFTYFECTDSTNTQAKLALRNGAPHGATFLADAQTGGRGRQGRAWHAASEQALLFSIALKPKLPAHQLSGLALVVGLGIREALAPHSEIGLEIKWPNDILVQTEVNMPKRKLAGILVESEIVSSTLPSVIVGVGINTSTTHFPEELRLSAASLSTLGSSLPAAGRETLLVELLLAIERWYNTFTHNGFAAIVPALNEHDALRGQRLRVTTSDTTVLGIASGIDSQGRLLLQTTAGLRAINSGTVEFDPA